MWKSTNLTEKSQRRMKHSAKSALIINRPMMLNLFLGSVLVGVATLITVSPALAYSEEDAKFVWNTNDQPVLKYIVCLEAKMQNPLNIGDALTKAEKSCKKLKAKVADADAEEIILGIMECGFKPGDADTCGDSNDVNDKNDQISIPQKIIYDHNILKPYNQTVACYWISDLKKWYALHEAGRDDLADQLDCMSVSKGTELILVERLDNKRKIMVRNSSSAVDYWVYSRDIADDLEIAIQEKCLSPPNMSEADVETCKIDLNDRYEDRHF
jgi:hypothetical protein